MCAGPTRPGSCRPEPPRRAPCSLRSASDLSKESKRLTVTGQDVIKSLKELEFDDLVDQMEICLIAFREAEKARSLACKAKRAKHSGDAAAGASADAGGEEGEAGEEAGDEEAE